MKLRATVKPKCKAPAKKLPVVSGMKNLSVMPSELVTCNWKMRSLVSRSTPSALRKLVAVLSMNR